MSPEIHLLLEIMIFSSIWTYIDYRIYRWAGMSPIFGSLKQDKPELKIRDFSFSIGITILIFSLADYFLRNNTDNLPFGFCTLKFWLYVSSAIAIAAILSRITIAYMVRKEDNGQSFVINGVIGGVLLVIGLLGVYIWYSF